MEQLIDTAALQAGIEALRIWAQTAFPNGVDPYAVLTRAELAQLWEDAEY